MKLNVKALKDVEIGIPVIAEGVYHARLDKVEVKPNKAGDGNNLVIMVKILDTPVHLHLDGKEITNNGQVVNTRHISLKPTDDYDPDKTLKELSVAIKLAPEADLNVEDLAGKIVMVKLGYRPETEDKVNPSKKYQAQNVIERFTPIKDDDTFTVPPF